MYLATQVVPSVVHEPEAGLGAAQFVAFSVSHQGLAGVGQRLGPNREKDALEGVSLPGDFASVTRGDCGLDPLEPLRNTRESHAEDFADEGGVVATRIKEQLGIKARALGLPVARGLGRELGALGRLPSGAGPGGAGPAVRAW